MNAILEKEPVKTESINLGDHRLTALPAATAIDDKGERVKAATRKFEKIAQSLQPALHKALEKVDLQLKPREASLKIVTEEMRDAFTTEMATLRSEQNKLEGELKELRQTRSATEMSITGKYLAAGKLATNRFNAEHGFISKVLENFPDAQYLDLGCLPLFGNSQGLPALALFNPNAESAVLTIGDPRRLKIETAASRQYSVDHSEWLTGRTKSQLLNRICGATGVLPRYDGESRYPASLQRAVKDQIKFADGRTQCAFAEEIQLQALFSAGGRTIPREARSIIRSAEKSKLFDAVLLLAEVPEWQIQYTRLNGPKPILEGTVVERRVSRDPLILGFKKLEDGRKFTLVLGKFDTTLIEELVRAEWATKP